MTKTVRSHDGTSIAYSSQGKGEPLVLVDPVMNWRETSPLSALRDELAQFFTVYTYDRRGKGDSGDAAVYDPKREFEDLQAVIEATGAPCNVYGFSSGAVLALKAAASGVPIKRIIAFEPPLINQGQHVADMHTQIAPLIQANKRAEAIDRFHALIGIPPEILAGMDFTAFEPVAHTILYDLTLIEQTTWRDLNTINVPTLVLASSSSDQHLQDWAKTASTNLPNGRVEILAGEWHTVPADVEAKQIHDFIENN